MSFAAMSAQVVTPDAYNKLQQDHEQLRAKTAQLVGQFKALKAEKEAAAAEAAAKNDAVVAKTRELVARYKASQAEVEDLRSNGAAAASRMALFCKLLGVLLDFLTRLFTPLRFLVGRGVSATFLRMVFFRVMMQFGITYMVRCLSRGV